MLSQAAAVQGLQSYQRTLHAQVETVPYDFRFPGINQARNCYTRYNEFYKCALTAAPPW